MLRSSWGFLSGVLSFSLSLLSVLFFSGSCGGFAGAGVVTAAALVEPFGAGVPTGVVGCLRRGCGGLFWLGERSVFHFASYQGLCSFPIGEYCVVISADMWGR